MQLINTQGLVLIGPGSDWFWSALSGLVLAVTVIALYRQLRLQANATAIEQLTAFETEWSSERLVRYKIGILKELREVKDVANLPDGPTRPIFNFWERIGVLARSGHIDPKLLAGVNGGIGELWWTILRPWILAQRLENGPTFGEGFEWLTGIIVKLNRQAGIADMEVGDLDAFIATLEYRVHVEEALRSVPVPTSRASKRPADSAPSVTAG